ncbi:hypothetical protein BC826DRAFT_1061779, partial [Russula brevipes]
MYQPHGRHRYAYGVNWRAAAAMIVSVPLTLPGPVNNINPKIHVGVGTGLFDIAYILGGALSPFSFHLGWHSILLDVQLTLESVVYF